MDQCIYISSSDDELEEIADPGRVLPKWAGSERNSGGRTLFKISCNEIYF
jgi:hypothetical protein